MLDPRLLAIGLAVALLATQAGCVPDGSAERDDEKHRAATEQTAGTAGRTAGPLVAISGEGYTVGPGASGSGPGDRQTVTGTFGTPLCTTDSEALIVIDDVSYETFPPAETEPGPGSRLTDVETWFRVVPPSDYPLVSKSGGPGELAGETTTLAEGPASPVDYECDGDYLEAPRTWPIVELLTVVTADDRGAVVRATTVEYHVGERAYTLTFDWEVGHCGTELPAKFRCSSTAEHG